MNILPDFSFTIILTVLKDKNDKDIENSRLFSLPFFKNKVNRDSWVIMPVVNTSSVNSSSHGQFCLLEPTGLMNLWLMGCDVLWNLLSPMPNIATRAW
jgi:hypothetical protein